MGGPASVDDTNGYRRYDESQLRDARLVRMLRQLDMPLADVARLMAAPRAERTAEFLQSVLSGGKESYPMYEIRTRDVDEQSAFTEMRHITAPNLPPWVGESFGRQHEEAARIGAEIGASMVIFHGEVTEDSDGPAEAVTTFDASKAPDASLPFRVEPAHREAYTRITKAQVRYPDILSAYDAVESWIAEHGLRIAGSPREIYLVDFMAAAEDDEVVDIAFVIAD